MRLPGEHIQANGYGRLDCRRERRGTTVIKAALATAFAGVAVVGMMVTLAAAARASEAGKELTQAVTLAQEIHEWTLRLPFSDPDVERKHSPPGCEEGDPQTFVDDLDDLIGATFCPPKSAKGTTIAGMPDWSQRLAVTWREPSNLTQIVAPGASDIAHVEVTIRHNGNQVFRTGWLLARRDSR